LPSFKGKPRPLDTSTKTFPLVVIVVLLFEIESGFLSCSCQRHAN
jgi:hypothetical protein